MKKPERQKTDNIGWILAFIFPKKAKPIPPKPVSAPVSTPPPAAPPLFIATPPAAPAPTTPPAAPAPTIQPVAKSPVNIPPMAPPPAPLPAAKAPAANAEAEKKPGLFTFQPGKLLPAFWTVAGGLSMLVNVILIVTLVIMAKELFTIKRLVGGHVLGGLYDNFVLMDQAHIKSQIKVEDTIPINFTLPISQDTVVVLTEPTYIGNVMINLNSGGLTINSLADITLPAGTNLPVHLQMDVPVTTMVPITLNVPVDIPLDQTELHEPFVGLQNVIGPFNGMLVPNINTPAEACKDQWYALFCDGFFNK